MNTDQLRDVTIRDFGEQWTTYTDNDGWYGSTDMLRDILGPHVPEDTIRGRRVAEIGSGTGRIVNMLIDMGAAHVTAIEPSAAYDVLRRNTAHHGDRVRTLQLRGDQVPEDLGAEHILSIGVLIIIPDPDPVVKAAWRALPPGGRFTVWLYGKEGNELYLSLFLPLMKLTRRLPHAVLAPLCWALTLPLAAYIAMCGVARLPLHGYIRNVIGPMSWSKRQLVIYDQLNPTFVKYYTRDEAEQLLVRHGFANVQVYWRHGYSYTVTGVKPAPAATGATRA
jgi:SAM-dependent methyltransferase